eukprot:3216719-Pyramimonas_sp.AAC.1
MKTVGSAMGPLGLLKRAWERRGAWDHLWELGSAWDRMGTPGIGSVLGACRERLGARRSAWER